MGNLEWMDIQQPSIKLPINYDKSHWSLRKVARDQYIKEQGGKCYHCGAPLDAEPTEEITSKKINMGLFPHNFFKYPIHLHHCHKSGMTIGAVHSKCNAVLWQYHGE